MRLRSLDIIFAGMVSIFTLVVVFSGIQTGASGFPAWFLPFGILMVLFIPGYALTLAILPQLDRATILLLSLGISISMDVMGGFILNYTPARLHPFSWAIWLSCLSVLGCMIAAYRRSLLSKEATSSSATPSWNWKVIASFILTSMIIIASIIIARNSAIKAGAAFTQLWAVPVTNEGSYAIQIGISNQELNTMHYDLFVESQGATIEQWTDIVLTSDESWMMSMHLMEKPRYPITFLLYKTNEPDKIYRTVHLVPESFDKPVSSPAE